jgi:hypothetical protein
VIEVGVQDRLYRAYARLTSLQQLLTTNLRGGFVGTQYVAEYHGALDQLEQAGFDSADFRIPPPGLRRRATGGNYLSGETYYSDGPEVEHGVFLMKVQAAISYFTLVTESPQRKIGFAGSSNN